MSDNEDYDASEMDYNDDEVLQDNPEVKAPKKKQFTAKQLETVRKNLEKAQAVRAHNIALRQEKKDTKQYKTYQVPRPMDDYEESDYSDEEEAPPKKKMGRPSAPPPTKKEIKEASRLDRIEKILYGIASAQKKVRKPVHNTIVQLPHAEIKKTAVPLKLQKLINLF